MCKQMRFSHYLRDIIDWYVWKLKIMKINEDYNKRYRVSSPIYIWFNWFGFTRCNYRDLASYKHCDSSVRFEGDVLPIKHDVRKVAPWYPILLNIRRLDDGKSCDGVLPVKYRYSSGYEHPNAYKDTSRLLNYRYAVITSPHIH